MRTMNRMGRWAPIVVVPTLLLAVAGCSGDDGDGEAGGQSETASESSTPSEAPTTGTISPKNLPQLPKIGQAQGAVADVEWDQSECGTTPGEQTVAGTVTNSTDDPTGYVIQINWTNATSDVLASNFATVRGAQPGEAEDWEVQADVPEGVTQCTIFAQRGSLPRP
ncbi:FxLYD domain-containing protein [Nocardioides litoris]|uniref:FxLYD domain-containing protein n=1 Tax=Nocardioides litoris TaxID=1926648 RepID=UPI001122A979|nr:FxLYD domain-containing protein [Nocardioides litoris]